MIESKCKICGSNIVRYGGRIGIFCSFKCKGVWQSENTSGKNNPNFRHGNHAYESYCKCGNQKDFRSARCSSCARVSYAKGNAINAWHLTKEEIEDAISFVDSFKDLAEVLNISRQYATKMVKKHKISHSHFTPGRGRFMDTDKILSNGSTRRNNTVRAVLLRENLIEYKCADCGLLPQWNKKKLTLQLNHINGDGCDNRIENLQFLCPNCHTQTTTFTGRNIKNEKEKE